MHEDVVIGVHASGHMGCLRNQEGSNLCCTSSPGFLVVSSAVFVLGSFKVSAAGLNAWVPLGEIPNFQVLQHSVREV